VTRAQRPFGGVHFASQCGIRRVGLAEKEHLQPFEMLQAAVMLELVAQFLHDSVKQRKRPAPFEDPLRRLIVRRLALVALFARREFERDNRRASPFMRALTIFFVSDKELQGSQQKRPEPALFRVDAIEISSFQQPDNEVLREVLCLIRRIAAAAQIGV
jgi:hypothetical protein